MKVVACIPVHGRVPLMIKTAERLIEKNGAHRVILVGDGDSERAVAKLLPGVDWVEHANQPLGAKWNAAFKRAADYDPDAVLFVGSSDWVSNNWIAICGESLQHADMVGKPDFYLADLGATATRVCHWPGYTDPKRKGEPIGIGRMLGRDIMKRMDWQPFNPTLPSSLDWSMYQRVKQLGGRVMTLKHRELMSLSLSTHRWPNLHRFEDHWTGKLPSRQITDSIPWLKKHFPEALTLFQ